MEAKYKRVETKDYDWIESKSMFSYEVVTELELETYIKNSFFRIFSILEPYAFVILKNNCLELFERGKMTQALSPTFEPDFRWEWFEQGSRKLSKERKALRCELLEWQIQFNLIERENAPKWIIRYVLTNILDYWAKSSSSSESFMYRREVGSPNFSQIKLAEIVIREKKLLPPRNLLEYKPYEITRKNFIKHLNLTEKVKKRIEEDPFLIASTRRSRNSFVREVVDNISAEVNKYCDEIESVYLNNEWIKVPEHDQLFRDLIWTVRNQIQCMSFGEIAELGKIESSKNYIGLKVKYVELTKDHFDVVELNRSTVKRSVDKILDILKLKPRRKTGRPIGKKTKAASAIIAKLGK